MTGPVTNAIRAMQGSVERSDLTDPTELLRERASALRERLSAITRKPPKTDPHVALRGELLAAHAAEAPFVPVFLAADADSAVYAAGLAASRRLHAVLGRVLALPAPSTPEGLAVLGLALALDVEGNALDRHERGPERALAARAILAATGTPLPPDFRGFGDEPEFDAREDAMVRAAGLTPMALALDG